MDYLVMDYCYSSEIYRYGGTVEPGIARFLRRRQLEQPSEPTRVPRLVPKYLVFRCIQFFLD